MLKLLKCGNAKLSGKFHISPFYYQDGKYEICLGEYHLSDPMYEWSTDSAPIIELDVALCEVLIFGEMPDFYLGEAVGLARRTSLKILPGEVGVYGSRRQLDTYCTYLCKKLVEIYSFDPGFHLSEVTRQLKSLVHGASYYEFKTSEMNNRRKILSDFLETSQRGL